MERRGQDCERDRCRWRCLVVSSIGLGLVACSNRSAPAKGDVTIEPPPSVPPPAPLDPGVPEAPSSEESFFEPNPSARSSHVSRPNAPNMRYVKLDRGACEAELKRRGVAFEHGPPTPGVVTPVWLRGPLHGISIHSELAPKVRARSSVELFDCRLVVAMDDFAEQLAARDVVEIVHMSAYRPLSSRGCTPKYRGKQHCAGLAVDVGAFKKKDGSMLVVKRDFYGKVGLTTCGPGAASPRPSSAASGELWSYVCDAAKSGTFHVMLTPNYNLAHNNHFHLELTPDADWMLIQ